MTYDSEKIANSEYAKEILRTMKLDGETYISELAEMLGSSETSISNIIKSLRESGHIERTKRDKRQFYEITGKGKDLLEIYEKIEELETQIAAYKGKIRDSIEE